MRPSIGQASTQFPALPIRHCLPIPNNIANCQHCRFQFIAIQLPALPIQFNFRHQARGIWVRSGTTPTSIFLLFPLFGLSRRPVGRRPRLDFFAIRCLIRVDAAGCARSDGSRVGGGFVARAAIGLMLTEIKLGPLRKGAARAMLPRALRSNLRAPRAQWAYRSNLKMHGPQPIPGEPRRAA